MARNKLNSNTWRKGRKLCFHTAFISISNTNIALLLTALSLCENASCSLKPSQIHNKKDKKTINFNASNACTRVRKSRHRKWFSLNCNLIFLLPPQCNNVQRFLTHSNHHRYTYIAQNIVKPHAQGVPHAIRY